MSEPFEYDVFLSYSPKDSTAVYALAERLKKDGLRVWLDAWMTDPGDKIGVKTQQGLERSGTLVVCMSPAYFDSQWRALDHHALLYGDTCGVFDQIAFATKREAEYALVHNGFLRYMSHPTAREFIALPRGQFTQWPHPNGRIYSSGRYWKE